MEEIEVFEEVVEEGLLEEDHPIGPAVRSIITVPKRPAAETQRTERQEKRRVRQRERRARGKLLSDRNYRGRRPLTNNQKTRGQWNASYCSPERYQSNLAQYQEYGRRVTCFTRNWSVIPPAGYPPEAKARNRTLIAVEKESVTE